MISHDTDDRTLLLAWARDGSQPAFAALAQRYAGLIYHAALRQTSRPELAEEAAQLTLAILARKAARVAAHDCPAAWLHRTACYEAAKLRRREHRHDQRMNSALLTDSTPDPDPWATAAPVLDAALNSLPEADRRVLMMKYFDGITFEQMAQRLGGEAAAWRQRGSRAVERLRRVFAGKGVVLSHTVIATGLGSALTMSAPPAVAASLSASSLKTAGVLTWRTLAHHTLHTMNIKQAAVLTGAVLAALVPLGYQYQANAATRTRVAALTTAADALRSAAGFPVPDRELGGGALPGHIVPATVDVAAPVTDLMELAEVLAGMESSGFTGVSKAVRMFHPLKALDTDTLEGLVLATDKLDLPTHKKYHLQIWLLRELSQKSPAAGVKQGTRIAATATTNDVFNVVSETKAALEQWVRQDPAGGRAWLVQARASGTLETKALSVSDDGTFAALLQQAEIAGLLPSNPEQAGTILKRMPPREAADALKSAGQTADPKVIADLAAALPADQRSRALGTILAREAVRNLSAVAEIVHASGAPARDQRVMLVDAATVGAFDSPRRLPAYEKVPDHAAWLRSAAPSGEADEAVGTFLATLAEYDTDRAMAAYEQEIAGHSVQSEVLAGAFVRHLARQSPQAFAKAWSMAQAMPSGSEKDRSIKALQASPHAANLPKEKP